MIPYSIPSPSFQRSPTASAPISVQARSEAGMPPLCDVLSNAFPGFVGHPRPRCAPELLHCDAVRSSGPRAAAEWRRRDKARSRGGGASLLPFHHSQRTRAAFQLLQPLQSYPHPSSAPIAPVYTSLRRMPVPSVTVGPVPLAKVATGLMRLTWAPKHVCYGSVPAACAPRGTVELTLFPSPPLDARRAGLRAHEDGHRRRLDDL